MEWILIKTILVWKNSWDRSLILYDRIYEHIIDI